MSDRLKDWFFLLMVTLFPVSVHAVISGSSHDLSGTGTNTGSNQICIFCHTPHNGDTTVTDAPLWNHEIDTSTAYTVYNRFSMDETPVQPQGVTKLCLSCHDGTVAIDSYGGMVGAVTMPGTPGTSGSPNFGTDLSDDHPVSVYWNHQTIWSSGDFCTGCHFGPDPGVEFFNHYIECASCHDVHNNTPWANMLLLPVDDPDGAGGVPGSALCLRCHEMSNRVIMP